jgi:hypothetical protein
MPSKEEVYDQKISPLMSAILEICKAHKIAMLADFALDEDLHCTSALLREDHGASAAQYKALDLLKPKEPFVMAETIETLPDGTKRVTIRSIS